MSARSHHSRRRTATAIGVVACGLVAGGVAALLGACGRTASRTESSSSAASTVPVLATSSSSPAPALSSTVAVQPDRPVGALTTLVAAPTSTRAAVAVPTAPSPATDVSTAGPTSQAPRSVSSGAVRVVAPGSANTPWLAATRATGEVELWSAAGKLASWSPCAGDPVRTCSSSIEAVSDRSVWIFRTDRSGRTQLLRAPLGGGALTQVDLGALAPDGSVRAVAVSTDGHTLWIAHADENHNFAALHRLRAGAVTTLAADGVVDVAISPDGRRLAYSHYRNVDTGGYPRGSAVVIVDLATGAERVLGHDAGDPFSAYELSWSADNRHLLVQFGWEGSTPMVVDVDAASSLDDAVVPRPVSAEPGGYRSTPACWSSPSSVALGLWSWGVESPGYEGALVDSDVTTQAMGTRLPALLGGDLACRSDGAVATVRFPTVDGRGVGGDVIDPDAQCSGDLVVIRPDGTKTVLGRGYVGVHGV